MPKPLTITFSLPESAELKIIFDWEVDRWMHRVVFECDGRQRSIMQSIEGDQQSIWPPSPPLQDASQHELTGGAAVLAVGMAGTSHWSASFSAEKSKQDAKENSASKNGSLLADLACLCKGKAPMLAGDLVSSYRLEPDVEAVWKNQEAAKQELEIRWDQHRLKLLPLSGENWTSVLGVDGDLFRISPSELNVVAAKPTRWGYRLFA